MSYLPRAIHCLTPGSVSLLELGEGDLQVSVAELWQSPSLHRRHQETREDPAPGVRPPMLSSAAFP